MSVISAVAKEHAVAFRRRPGEPHGCLLTRRLASNIAQPYKFAFARTALKYGLQSLGFKRGDALLIPEFVCDVLIEPLDILGVEPQFYQVGLNLEPDWSQLANSVKKHTKALLVVHYFGQPQSIADSLNFCREHSLLLIEDNAHGFGGTFEGQLLGTFGDIGISAPRKSFSLNVGAYLYTKNRLEIDLSALQLYPCAPSPRQLYLKSCIKKIPIVEAILNYRARIIEYRKRNGAPAAYGSQAAFRESPIQDDYGMDESMESFLKRQDLQRIREIRQQIYNIWQDWTSTQGLAPVFPCLLPEAMPLVFPALTESAASSLKWYARGHRAGVDIHSWPTLPQAIVEKNSDAMRLWERLLCFPIHQEMDVQLLRKRLAVL